MSGCILIVEDEPAIADNITYALSTEGFTPVRCGTGAEARRLLSETNPALIILDVGLPDVSGFDLARQIRRTSHVPIIFVTARSEEIDRILGLELGADDYIVKPFSPRELTARVRAVLRRTQTSVMQSVDASESAFRVDRERFQIFLDGTALALSRYEFRILEILIHKPGRVYSRAQLMALAWEEPDMSLERTVDTHIKTIRKKIRELRDEELIITHRGLGYSLKEDL